VSGSVGSNNWVSPLISDASCPHQISPPYSHSFYLPPDFPLQCSHYQTPPPHLHRHHSAHRLIVITRSCFMSGPPTPVSDTPVVVGDKHRHAPFKLVFENESWVAFNSGNKTWKLGKWRDPLFLSLSRTPKHNRYLLASLLFYTVLLFVFIRKIYNNQSLNEQGLTQIDFLKHAAIFNSLALWKKIC